MTTTELDARLERINKLRKQATQSAQFSEEADEHRKAIEQQVSAQPFEPKKLRRKKSSGRRTFAERYADMNHSGDRGLN